MEVDDMKDKEGKKKEEKPPVLFDVTFDKINLDEALGVGDEEKKLIGGKRKRKGKKIPLQLFSKKSKNKVNPTLFQKIFDELAKKTSNITEDNVLDAAEKHRVKLDRQNINFFLEISNARASLKKIGLISDICKHKFHVYANIEFYKDASVITDDKIVWNVYYSYFVSKSEQKTMYSNSILEDFSVVSDKVFSCKKFKSGYIQDYLAKVAIINDTNVDPLKVDTIKENIKKGGEGIIKLENLTSPGGATYNFYQYYSLILAGKVNLDQLLKDALKIQFFNSKNKLAIGLKDVKINDEIGSYLNITETKFTDFSPSCVFTNPAIPKIRMFVRGYLDTNTLFNSIKDSMTSPLEIPLPPNAVFWDNIDSFVQMIALYKFIQKPPKEEMNEAIKTVVTLYYNNRDILNAWKKIYKNFETIVLNFYDGISNRLTIDGVTNLEAKIAVFLANYTYLKNEERGLNDIRMVIGNIPRVQLMNNFISTNVPYELCTMLARLIIVLKSGKKQEGLNIEDMFRTVGYLCSRVLFGGDYACIPKVRSFAAFLGGVSGTMSNDTFKKNLEFLINKFKEGLKDKSGPEKKMFNGVEGVKKVNEILEQVLRNSEKKLKNAFVSENYERLVEKIKGDKTLYNSLLDDVENMVENDGEDDTKLYGDFLDNDLFNSFIIASGKLWDIMSANSEGANVNEVINSVSITPGSKKKNNDVDFSEAEYVELAALPISSVVNVNLGKLERSYNKLKVENDDIIKKLNENLGAIVKNANY